MVLRGRELREFWTSHLANGERRVLFVMGRGFDPRTALGIDLVTAVNEDARVDVMGLEFRGGPVAASKDHSERAGRNWERVREAVGGRGQIELRAIEFLSEEGRRTTSQNARHLFTRQTDFGAYSDIVVDVSAMPRSVYFPLIARILFLVDQAGEGGTAKRNVHLMVAEDVELDARIRREGIDEKAEFLASFGGRFDEESVPTPKVWIPMLGEGRGIEFERIYDRIKPDEICPVLPFPAQNPRRADDLVAEYRSVLFDELRLDPRSFVHVAERNPFQVYRKLRSAVDRYREVFTLLGGCRIALSPLSSKLMSIGALLVAYEMRGGGYRVGVAHIESQGYRLEEEGTASEISGFWLAGECDVS